MGEILVREVMTPNPVTLSVSNKLVHAIEIMSGLEIGSVIVEKEDKAFNIITQRDIIYALSHNCEDMEIGEFIEKCKPKRKFFTILNSATVYEAMELMEKEKVKHLPVVDKDGKVVGIITATDILRKVTHVALVDPLTKVYNRKYLDVLYFKLRKRMGFSLLMMDIDDFKKINDTYGHVFGDKVLANLGKVLLKCIRNYDDAIRYGGEEFLVVLYRANIEEAKKVAERIREMFSKIEYEEVPGLKVTVSIGIAQGINGENLWDIIKKADQALYKAKKNGKNRVEVYGKD